MLYLDHAATTPVRPEVLDAMLPYLSERFGNPSSHHTVGEAAASVLADARRRIASVVGMRPADVVFTSGGTEADNLAVKGIAIGTAGRRRGARRRRLVEPADQSSVGHGRAARARRHRRMRSGSGSTRRDTCAHTYTRIRTHALARTRTHARTHTRTHARARAPARAFRVRAGLASRPGEPERELLLV